jgi:hypothetical protein
VLFFVYNIYLYWLRYDCSSQISIFFFWLSFFCAQLLKRLIFAVYRYVWLTIRDLSNINTTRSLTEVLLCFKQISCTRYHPRYEINKATHDQLG